MSPIYFIYNEFLYRPLFNALVLIYNFLPFHDLGLSIIILTVLLRLALFPFSRKAVRSQKSLAEIQPQITEIQKKFKDNKEEQAKRLMSLYAEKGVNPFSGCLPILIQLPLLIALYNVFWRGLNGDSFSILYSFVSSPGSLNTTAFGYLDLSRPNFVLGALAGVTQFLQAKFMPQAPSVVPGSAGSDKSSEFAKAMRWQTNYFLPFIIFVSSFKLPAALPLYWTILNLFGIIEYGNISRFLRKR